MPRLVEEPTAPASAQTPEPEESLGPEYDDMEIEVIGDVTETDFGQIPSESRAWMGNMKRMQNLVADAKIRIARIKKQQEELPTSHELLADDRKPTVNVVYEIERRANIWAGATLQDEITFDAILQELNTLDRELRSNKGQEKMIKVKR